MQLIALRVWTIITKLIAKYSVPAAQFGKDAFGIVSFILLKPANFMVELLDLTGHFCINKLTRSKCRRFRQWVLVILSLYRKRGRRISRHRRRAWQYTPHQCWVRSHQCYLGRIVRTSPSWCQGELGVSIIIG